MKPPAIHELFLFLLVFGCLVLPGILLTLAYKKEESWSGFECLALGIILGMAFHVVMLPWFALIDMRYHGLATGIFYVGSLGLFLRKKPKLNLWPSHRNIWIGLILGVQGMLCFSVYLQNSLPHGADAIYHVSIAQKFLSTGHVPKDFLPYDMVAPNYPPGSHWFVAWVSLLSRLPVHRVYQFLEITSMLMLSTVLYGLGKTWKNHALGIATMTCFALTMNWGSLDLMRWGSLPNMFGVLFFLSSLYLIFKTNLKTSFYWGVAFIAAMILSHHLTALMFALFTVAYALVIKLKKQPISAMRSWVLSTFFAGVLAMIFIIPFTKEVILRLLEKSPSAGEEISGPAFVNVAEPALMPWQWVEFMGPLFFILSVIGLWQYLKNQFKGNHQVIGYCMLFLASTYFILDWPVRYLLKASLGHELALLTPSRFFTNTLYFLSVFAGLGLLWFFKKNRWIGSSIVLAGIIYSLWIISPLWPNQMAPTEMQGLVWFKKSSPKNSLLLNNPFWSPYLTEREGERMVLRQEKLGEHTLEKRQLLEKGPKAVQQWIKKHERPIYLWVDQKQKNKKLELVWKNKQYLIYRFNPDY